MKFGTAPSQGGGTLEERGLKYLTGRGLGPDP